MSLEQNQQDQSVFAQLRRHPEPKQTDEHNKWVEMPQEEFDKTVNEMQNFDEEPSKKRVGDYLRAAAIIGIPLGIALMYAAQGFKL